MTLRPMYGLKKPLYFSLVETLAVQYNMEGKKKYIFSLYLNFTRLHAIGGEKKDSETNCTIYDIPIDHVEYYDPSKIKGIMGY